jgi:tetratricopeptide (TPR) repeat protein
MQSILKDLPQFLEGRHVLRKAAIQKKTAAGKKFLSVNTAGLSVIKIQQKAKKDPAGAMVEVEAVLAEDPYNVQANHLLAECANAMSMPSTAAFALETVRTGHPQNTKSMHLLAEHYMANDQPDLAVNIYKSIQNIDATDGEARKGFTNANAKLSMKQQKWDAEGTGIRSLMHNSKEAAMLELASKQGMTSEQSEELLANYMDLYAQDQTNINHVQKIAEILERLDRIDEAYQYYSYAHSLSNGDTSLEVKVHKLQDKLSERYLHQLEAWINENPTHPDLPTQVEELGRLKLEREERLVAVARDRVEKNPTDMALRYELGSHLFNSGHATEAIPELQKAKGNPHIRTKAMLILAQCYEQKNMVDLAIRQLEEGVGELHGMDATKKEALYLLGNLHAKQGHADKALEARKLVYESDYNFRDIAHLVESAY